MVNEKTEHPSSVGNTYISSLSAFFLLPWKTAAQLDVRGIVLTESFVLCILCALTFGILLTLEGLPLLGLAYPWREWTT